MTSRIARIAEATASLAILTDALGSIVWVNASFTRITGYAVEEAVGRSPGDLLQGADTDPLERARIGGELRARRIVTTELINYGKCGRRYWVGMRIEPLFDAAGELEGFMAIGTEITERHERRQAHELLTRRFELATRSARVGMYERDTHSGSVWWSAIMCELFGEDPAVFRPSWEQWLTRVHPDDRDYFRENAGSATRARTSPSLQYRILRRDGAIRHVESIGSTEERLDSIITGIVIDVTERARSAEREKSLQQQLRERAHQAGMAEIATGVLHNVGNVLNSLGIANGAARRELNELRLERLQQTSRLIRDQGATLGTFLTEDPRGKHLPGYLEALADRITTHVSAAQLEMATMDRLLHHLRDIVTAQQASAQVGGVLEPIDLRELVETAILVEAPALAPIEVVREYEPLPRVTSDRHKLLQILVNFLRNARHAVMAGTTRPGRITLRLVRDEAHALISVEDSGVGMTPEALAQLWRYGFTTKRDGHGFGLHNCANAARVIGASVEGTSDGPEKGARFTIRLTLDAGAESAPVGRGDGVVSPVTV